MVLGRACCASCRGNFAIGVECCKARKKMNEVHVIVCIHIYTYTFVIYAIATGMEMCNNYYRLSSPYTWGSEQGHSQTHSVGTLFCCI